MTLWIALSLMTLIAAMIVIVPMLRSGKAATTRDSYSLEVYRDQLRELDSDAKRGLLTDEEIRFARLEIERRMLALSTEKASPDVAKSSAARSLPVLALIALAIAGSSFFLYAQLGSPDVPGQPFAERTPEPDDGQPGRMQQVIEQLAKRLEADPSNLDGWTLLGQSYTAIADYDNAANAFQQAMKLAPGGTDLLMSYGESLVLGSGNQVIPAAKDAFEQALKVDPQHMGARFYLAEYESQSGNTRAAMDTWLKLVSESPEDAPWMPALLHRLDLAAKELNIDLATVLPKALPAEGNTTEAVQSEAAPGPSQEDVAAAQDMSADDRANMIRTMVERLAERLKEEPDNLEGWQRLARAYGVLGEQDKAREAFAQINRLQPDNIDGLMQQASMIIEGSDRAKPLPQEAVDIFARVLTLKPDNQDALYFSGLAASQKKQFDLARTHWNKLLGLLPKDGQAWQAVNGQLEKLPLQ